MNETLKNQLLTIVAKLKKAQQDIKNNTTSISELDNSGSTLIKILKNMINQLTEKQQEDLKDIINQINTIKNDYKNIDKQLDSDKINYIKSNECLLNEFKRGLEEIEQKLSSFISNKELKELETKIDKKINKINVTEQITKIVKGYATKNDLKMVESKIKEIKIPTSKVINGKDADEIEIGLIDTFISWKPKVSKKWNKIISINDLIGARGIPGEGVKPLGTTGQVLAKKSNNTYDTEWKTLNIPTKTSEIENNSGFITIEDVPEYVLPDLYKIIQPTFVLSGSVGSTTTIKLPYGVNITEYEVKTDVATTCSITIDTETIALTNESLKSGSFSLSKIADEYITATVSLNDNADVIYIFLKGVKS